MTLFFLSNGPRTAERATPAALSRRLTALAVGALLVAGSAPRTAYAGDRAFYLSFIDISATPAELDPRRDSVWAALLGCPLDEPLPACRARHAPDVGEDTSGAVVLLPMPAGATADVVRAALRGGAAARAGRVALTGAYANADAWPDGIIVYDASARGVSFAVLTPEGRLRTRVRRTMPPTGPTPAMLSATVRAIMRPVEQHFSP